MNFIELLAVIFSLAYVFLASKESIWCWPAALISVSLYVYICLKASLFAETGLQVFYFVIGIYGWMQWSNKKQKEPLTITKIPLTYHVLIITCGLLSSYGLGWYLSHYTNAAIPYLDAFTTCFSLFATWLVARKILENWLYWIVIDAASMYLYAQKKLYLTVFLFFVYTVIAIVGFMKWQKTYNMQHK